jgi:hypothetical protein
MTQSFEDDETDENGRYTFGLEDHIEIVANDIDEAIHDLEAHEIERLCTAIRSKIGDVLREVRQRQQLDQPASEPPERDDGYRWWDR